MRVQKVAVATKIAAGTITVVGFLAGFSQALWAGPWAAISPLVSGLDRPVAIENCGDGSNRLFILELFGKIRVIEEGQLVPEPFLDLSDRVDRAELEGGLLGLAFHPAYRDNGRFFVNYTTSEPGGLRTRVSRFEVSAQNPNRAGPEETVILEFEQPTGYHNAGDLAFGPDGYLYIATGDGGPPGDPDQQGQNLTTLLGAILRIDVDGQLPYEVPADNPFVGLEGAREEIFAYGLRNPFRIAFDRLTGRLFAGDVGEARFEEVDIVVKGGNYGWRCMEGLESYKPEDPSCEGAEFVSPIWAYGRPDGRSVTGGLVYRGTQSPELWGRYLFGDFVSGRIWTLREVGPGSWHQEQLRRVPFLLVAFGEDESGQVYLADFVQGQIWLLGLAWQEVIAQAGDGISAVGTFSSTILLTNNHDEEVAGAVLFFNSEGAPAQVQIDETTASLFEFTLPPRSSRALRTAGRSQPLYAGWAHVRSTRSLSSSVLYSLQTTEGNSVTRAGIASSEMSTTFAAPFSRNGALQTDTALAVANPSTLETTTVRLVLQDSAGTTLAENSFELGPMAHRAFFLADVAELPDTLEGTLQIDSDRPVAPTLLLTSERLHAASLPVGR